MTVIDDSSHSYIQNLMVSGFNWKIVGAIAVNLGLWAAIAAAWQQLP